ncbi:hypothetical protein ISREJYDI_CDS0056 [Pseudomonas phage UNO-G1W1]|uniref:Uncharacterized protein n=1 Tax=Pseudomonas phage UNO-G1W1 TaxID=3136609 RepID=A0AAX4MV60_9CAUD
MSEGEQWFMAVIYTVGIGLLALFFVNMAVMGQDCERKGGVLMKPAIGAYTCVKPVK